MAKKRKKQKPPKKKMNQTVKEIIQIAVFLIVVAAVIVGFFIYPLSVTKSTMGRDNIDDFNPDSLPANDPSYFASPEYSVDTFRVEPDALTSLACLYMTSTDTTLPDTVRGTVFLLHSLDGNRQEMRPFARTLADSGYAVVAYDQRATHFSGGKYHSAGTYETIDLEEVIAFLEIRDLAARPLYVVGQDLGAEAALRAGREENRIDRVVAINPHLTTTRLIDDLREKHDPYWLPFFRTIYWFWYKIRSGYAAQYVEVENIEAVGCPTLLIMPENRLNSEAVAKLAEESPDNLLTVAEMPADTATLVNETVKYLLQP